MLVASCITFARITVLIGGAIFLLTSPEVSKALPIDYVFVPNTQVSYGGTGALSGTFTYDISTTTLTNIDVVLSGTPYSGTYSYSYDPWNTSNPTILGLMVDSNSNSIDTHMLLLYFASNLNGTPGITLLTNAFGYNPQPTPGNNTLTVLSGGVALATTPIPAALPLFATGLGVTALLGWRAGKRKATGIAA